MAWIYGCAGAPQTYPPRPEGIAGIYHQVEKGETLWRISKAYNADLDEIAEINHISDASKIEVGQSIFIPHKKAVAQRPVITSGNDDFIWPLKGRVIATFNQCYDNIVNKGINIRPSGQEQSIVAARSGKIVFISPNFKKYGKTLIIDHQDGYMSVYARNAQIFKKTGDYVKQGEPVARVGSEGDSHEIYLHFEIRKGHLPKNPLFYLP